ncbi:condensation domain-containing protein [Actinomadura sp. 21ATH]|uniref:condensation domain-containing protein n=1 Tax=Actinomadura sp. 21ATH TaxID=1735444 RepID=UPI0035C049CD
MSGPGALSAGQQGLWLLHRMAPESAAYTVVTPVRLRTAPADPLDVPRLAAAVREVAGRHELLRSVFEERDGVPVRRELGPGALRLEVREAAGEDPAAAAGALGCVPFRLGDGDPPVRLTLLRETAHEAVLVLAAHHIVTDASSQWIVLADLLRAYREPGALGRGPRPMPYAEFVERERALLAGPERARLAAARAAECAGVPALEIPPDRPRPARPAFRGGTLRRTVPGPAAKRLPETAAALEVSPFGLLLGTLCVLAHRYSGRSDGLIGCSVTQRRGSRQRDAVGYLVNAVPLRARLDPAGTLGDAARAMHRRVLDGMRHARLPLAGPAGGPGPDGAPGRAPGFRILVTYVAAGPLVPLSGLLPTGPEGPEVEYGGMRLRQLDVPQMEGQFDLSVELRQGAGGDLAAVFRYDGELFERATAERLLDHFVRLLETAAEAPGTPAADAAPAAGEELARVLAWGRGDV